MEIKVTHKVPYDKGYETRCMYNDGDFWGNSVCAYHVYRDRTHGRQAPVERRLPKCALFGVWLDGEYKKCDACLEACKEALRDNTEEINDAQFEEFSKKAREEMMRRNSWMP